MRKALLIKAGMLQTAFKELIKNAIIGLDFLRAALELSTKFHDVSSPVIRSPDKFEVHFEIGDNLLVGVMSVIMCIIVVSLMYLGYKRYKLGINERRQPSEELPE